MKVICKGYKICVDKETCEHSKIHTHNINETCDCENVIYKYGNNCICSTLGLRKLKLKKLNENR